MTVDGTQPTLAAAQASIPVRVRMVARPVDEPHRASTQLELLFDLTFVVAVAAVVTQLGHALAGGHVAQAMAPFLQVFFAVWWAWMNFTWFASSYDTDDVPYRLLTLLQMGGVLVLAAGVPSAFGVGDYALVTFGFLLMRTGLVALWLRAAREDPAGRTPAVRYAAGVGTLELLWLLRLVLQDSGPLTATTQTATFAALGLAELAVPAWAERRRRSSWHPHHIAERYTLFVIILLGEGVLAVSTGLAGASGSGPDGASAVAAASGLALLFALWWIYELEPSGDGLRTRRRGSFLWGYGHYGVFAALAALGAGLEVAVADRGAHTGLPTLAAGYAVAIPTAAFLALLWASRLPIAPRSQGHPAVLPGTAVVVLLVPLAGRALGVGAIVALVALTAAGAVAVTLALARAGASVDARDVC